MRQTLFYIPHEIGGYPLFGAGILLCLWLISAAGWLWWVARTNGKTAVWSFVPFVVVVAIAIRFVFPLLEAKDPAGRFIGLPVRGYGTLVLAGFIAGVGWSIHRARQRGVAPEIISSLAFWMLLAGFFGARLFFVIEYWDEFQRSTGWATLVEVMRFTEGGLVVYGALLATIPALIIFCWLHSLSFWTLGDIVAPGFAIGLALGRIGCLMNGCCYGGVCEQGPIGVHFPRFNSIKQGSLSPPYQHQLSTGRLHGFVLGENSTTHTPIVASVVANSAASQAGLTSGIQIAAINSKPTADMKAGMRALTESSGEISVEDSSGAVIRWSVGTLPAQSLPVHPAQIYSSISALLLCFVLVSAEPYLRRQGSVLALMLTLYPPLRILEEIIRVDEPGQFGTGLTISQLISIGTLVVAAGLWAYIFWREPVPSRGAGQHDAGLSAA